MLAAAASAAAAAPHAAPTAAALLPRAVEHGLLNLALLPCEVIHFLYAQTARCFIDPCGFPSLLPPTSVSSRAIIVVPGKTMKRLLVANVVQPLEFG